MIPSRSGSPGWRTFSALAAMAAWAPVVLAHTFLDHALPAADSSMREPPASVSLWFSEPLESAFSRVEVMDSASRRVDNADSRVDGADAKLMRATLPRLAPGRYRVRWRAISVDAHVAEGELSFEVRP
jgi:methionine-rich copper-binding protein CopC